jgi:hypothetical protein
MLRELWREKSVERRLHSDVGFDGRAILPLMLEKDKTMWIEFICLRIMC